jgi:hypothetical protein
MNQNTSEYVVKPLAIAGVATILSYFVHKWELDNPSMIATPSKKLFAFFVIVLVSALGVGYIVNNMSSF